MPLNYTLAQYLAKSTIYYIPQLLVSQLVDTFSQIYFEPRPSITAQGHLVSLDERQGTLWTTCQTSSWCFIVVDRSPVYHKANTRRKNNFCTYGLLRDPNSPNLHVFGLWGETGAQIVACKCMQTCRRTCRAGWSLVAVTKHPDSPLISVNRCHSLLAVWL